MSSPAKGPQLTCLGWAVILVVVAIALAGAAAIFLKDARDLFRPASDPANSASPGSTSATPDTVTAAGDGIVEIGIAYGTEKERWLKSAVEEFRKTSQGKKIGIRLIPMGSLEGAKALLAGDERIHVWSPASALYRDVFVQDWELKNGKPPILKTEPLALSPMVFVMWEERYQEFVRKYATVSFQTVAQAIKEPGGWDAIASKPEWGLFKFGHTHPGESNSGLMSLVLMACNYHNKQSGLQMKDILDVGFQSWLTDLERGVSGLANSTGTMMKEMVLKGPSSFDALIVYENVAIDFLKNAEGRWGKLRLIYPQLNMWNENPYYVIDAPWSTDAQREAAEIFLEFLMSDAVQKNSLVHGFRPGNPAVPIKFPESPFMQFADYGLQIDVGPVCDPPAAEVLNNLLAGWERSQGHRG